MDDKRKYDPEDIESLMMHKTFEELYPEEKTFVLEHLDSATEYESMRKTMLTVIAASNDHDRIVANPAIKDNLLAEFGAQKHGGFTIWLNSVLSWLAPPKTEWYRKPACQMTFASFALLIGAFIFILSDDEVRFADATKPSDDTATNRAPSNSLENNEPTEMIEEKELEDSQIETPAADFAETLQIKDEFITTSDQSNDTNPGQASSTFDATNESTFNWDLAEDHVVTEDVALNDNFNDERFAENGKDRTEELKDIYDRKAENEIEEEINKVEIVTSDKLASEKVAARATVPAMIDDISIEMSEIRDDVMGNSMIGEMESVKITSIDTVEDAGIATGSDVDFEGESLFSKKATGMSMQASASEYKDLIDLLYTAM